MPVDPYTGWKNYCDAAYKLCFKYPTAWTLQVYATAARPCDRTQILITSHDGHAVANYLNANSKDAMVGQMNTTSTTKLSTDGTDLSIIGGYRAYSTGQLPFYGITGTSALERYSIKIGETNDFLTSPRFTNHPVDSISCSGTFMVQPDQELADASGARAWFNTDNAKTSLKILESVYVQS